MKINCLDEDKIFSCHNGASSQSSEIFFQLQDSCLTDCNFLQDKSLFCRTILYAIIVVLVIFSGHLSDRIKYFVIQKVTEFNFAGFD